MPSLAVQSAILGGGIAFLFAAFVYARSRRVWIARTVRTTGTVIGFEVSKNAEYYPEGVPVAPVIRFVASDGRSVVFRSNIGTYPALHEVGQRVDLRYDPACPGEATLESGDPYDVGSIILAGIGAVMIGFAAYPLLTGP